MDGQNKQKVMIAVIMVAVLGAGASFFAFRDLGAGGAKAPNTGLVARRVHESSQTEEKPTRRALPIKSRDKPKALVIRRPRNEEDQRTVIRREKRRTDRKRTKKESRTPAG